MSAVSRSAAERLLICGPVLPSSGGDGLSIALADLASALRARGWIVDLAVTAEALGLPPSPDRAGLVPRWTGRRSLPVPGLRFLPADARLLLQHLLLGGGVARAQSDAMRALEARLAHGNYTAVVAFVYRFAPGLARFAVARHPRVALLSLGGLPAELRLARWLRLPRLLKLAVPGRLHDDLYRPVNPADVRLAVFASGAWRDDAVRAGLPAAVARVVPFGVPHPPPLPPLALAANRLLWVGRCSPDKGLHLFIEALAVLRRTRPATLTAICGDGPARYLRDVERRIDQLGLREAVALRPAVPRGDLPPVYAAHDALLFDSPYRDPVALVLMEAFSAGLPAVAPTPAAGAALVVPDETAVCFASRQPGAIARAIARALDDDPLRQRVRAQAHARILADFTLDAMGRKFDVALRTLLG